MTDFDAKLSGFNKRTYWNKIKHVPTENEINDQSKKVGAISIRGLRKHLINEYQILNGARYFSSRTR